MQDFCVAYHSFKSLLSFDQAVNNDETNHQKTLTKPT